MTMPASPNVMMPVALTVKTNADRCAVAPRGPVRPIPGRDGESLLPPLSLARGLPGWPGGGGFPEAENEVHAGPGAVDVLERLAALIVPGA
jgi:hypothetical protein